MAGRRAPSGAESGSRELATPTDAELSGFTCGRLRTVLLLGLVGLDLVVGGGGGGGGFVLVEGGEGRFGEGGGGGFGAENGDGVKFWVRSGGRNVLIEHGAIVRLRSRKG